jgi:hypothetical protein
VEKAARVLPRMRVIGGILELVISDTVLRGLKHLMFPLVMLVEVEMYRRRVPLRTHSMISVLPECFVIEQRRGELGAADGLSYRKQ